MFILLNREITLSCEGLLECFEIFYHWQCNIPYTRLSSMLIRIFFCMLHCISLFTATRCRHRHSRSGEGHLGTHGSGSRAGIQDMQLEGQLSYSSPRSFLFSHVLSLSMALHCCVRSCFGMDIGWKRDVSDKILRGQEERFLPPLCFPSTQVAAVVTWRGRTLNLSQTCVQIQTLVFDCYVTLTQSSSPLFFSSVER